MEQVKPWMVETCSIQNSFLVAFVSRRLVRLELWLPLGVKAILLPALVLGAVQNLGSDLIEGLALVCILPGNQTWHPALVPSGEIPFFDVATPHSH